MDIFEEFIRNHEQDDTARLLLGRSRWPDIDMDLAVHTLEGRRRMRTKAPSWHAFYGLRYPTRLCTEQCSSEATARYKAALASRIVSSGPMFTVPPSSCPVPSQERGAAIADLTGGLGLDTWAFATTLSSCPVDSVPSYPAGSSPSCPANSLSSFPADPLPSCPARPGISPAVLHNEMNPDLSAAVRHNYAELGLTNVTFRSMALVPGNLKEILAGSALPPDSHPSDTLEKRTPTEETPDAFEPDLIYLDPARRATDGSKVFRLEDCQPDVLTLLPELLSAAPHLLLKISPMADISLIVSQLNVAAHVLDKAPLERIPSAEEVSSDTPSVGQQVVREVHIVGYEGECKELLLWLDRSWNADYTLHVSEILDLNGTAKTLTFPAGCESAATPTYATAEDLDSSGIDVISKGLDPAFRCGTTTDSISDALLFEPGKALAKAGLYNTLSQRYGLRKLSRHTHLYLLPNTFRGIYKNNLMEKPSDTTSGEVTESMFVHIEELRPFGKIYQILEVHELTSKLLKTLHKTWPAAEVTAKDLPLTSDQLRTRLKVRPSPNIHIFGCRIATPILLITRVLPR